MSRLIPFLSLSCLAAIGVTTYSMLDGGDSGRIPVPRGSASADASASASAGSQAGDPGAGDPARKDPGRDDLSKALLAARRSCSAEQLQSIVGKLQQRAANQPGESNTWLQLAEALLERVVQRGHLLGMRPGHPTYGELPQEIVADLDAAQKAVGRARELGDDSAELFRISAQIMSQRITGFATALKWNGKIQDAIARAGDRAENDPKLHVVLGLRKLMAPSFFGHDPEKALEHFRYAADALPDDERPALFAAMASYLQKKRLDAIAWLEKAVKRNPHNIFARITLERARRGEKDPFGRNVTAVEAASGR